MRKLFSMLVLVAAVLALAASTLAADRQPVKILIITGDHGHDWKETTPFLKDLLTTSGMTVDVTETPSKDLTPGNLDQYDALLLNYKDTKSGAPESRWSEQNKKAFADAVSGGKGLVVYHHASSAFVSGEPWDAQFERIIAGGWRKQGNHGKKHEYTVKMTSESHPITKGMPAEFAHSIDELYQNSVMFPDNVVLATAWSDKSIDPKNSDKHEPIVWVTSHGKGRVVNNVLGHDAAAMQDQGFKTLMVRCVEWAATGDVKTPVPNELKTAPAAPAAGQ